MRVTLLGTGTPSPNPKRCQSAVLVEVGNDQLLFDTGRGVITQLARAGADLSAIGPVFITHHHLDHINDLLDVIFTTAMCGRTETMHVYGPVGTKRVVDALVGEVLAPDLRTRGGLDPACMCSEVEAGVVCETRAWRVTAARVRHGDFEDFHCLGYRVESGDTVVTISGDTVPCEGISGLARGADLLVQCCHFPDSALTDPDVASVTQHSLPCAGQVGRLAAEAGVKHVVLTHISDRVATTEDRASLRADVEREFNGKVTVGADLMEFEV